MGLHWSGSGLQLTGLGVAGYGVTRRRKEYSTRPGIPRWLATRIGSVPGLLVRLIRGRHYVDLGQMTAGAAVGTVTDGLAITDTAKQELLFGPLEERLSVSERIGRLDQRTTYLSQCVAQLTSRAADLGTAVAGEANVRRNAVDELQRQTGDLAERLETRLASAMTGDLPLEAAGLGWAALGSLLSMLSVLG